MRLYFVYVCSFSPAAQKTTRCRGTLLYHLSCILQARPRRDVCTAVRARMDIRTRSTSVVFYRVRVGGVAFEILIHICVWDIRSRRPLPGGVVWCGVMPALNVRLWSLGSA